MPDISKLTLPSGSTYDIKDAVARENIEELRNAISGGIHYVGVTTTELTDGATTKPITINSKSYTQIKGDVVNYGPKEFIWDDAKWVEFGDLGAFKALAYKDSASGSYTPAGSVTKPTFTGTKDTISVKGTPSGNVTISKGTGTANYTPEGSVSTPTITVTPNTETVNSITDVGSLPSFTATVENENLTFAWDAGALPTKGSNTTVVTGIESATSSQPSFTGTGAELKATFTGNELTSSAEYTPAGDVSKPTFTGTAATITVS